MSQDGITPTTWRSQAGYVWSLIGSAVGFANLLSFSAHAYKNGGGAFLIPYFFALFVLGIPLLVLEGSIGYRWKLPLIEAYNRIWKRPGKFVGWLAVLACFTIGGFYIVLTGYSVAYAYFSAVGAIPSDAKSFFLHDFLHVSSGLQHMEGITWTIAAATAVVALISWFVLVRNVRDGIERACSLFMPLLTALILFFAVIACLLPGGLNGFVYYLTPDFSRLLDPQLWRDIFGQLFFSLSLGLGIIVGYSRHTERSINIGKAMLYTALGDFAVSFVAGLAVFAFLAHISYVENIPFVDIMTTESSFDIGFVLFPQLLKTLGPIGERLVGTLFFLSLFIAGITGVFSIVESVAGNIEHVYKVKRSTSVTLTLLALLLCSFVFCTGNSPYLIEALVPMVVGTNMLLGGLALIFAFVFASQELRNESVWMKKGRLTFTAVALRYIAPSLLAIILLGNLWQEFQGFDLPKAVRWGWFFFALLSAALLARFKGRQGVEQQGRALVTQQAELVS